MLHSKSQLSILLTTSIILIFVTYQLFSLKTLDVPTNTYNPLTFKKGSISGSPANSNNPTLLPSLLPKEKVIEDEALQQLLNNDINNHCPIYTFFNDEKIKQLPLEEQNFHKLMLKRWILYYNSLGFSTNVVHYNDAINNPRLGSFLNKGLLFNKDNQIRENYLKLLAWEYGLSRTQHKGSLYSDYTIFPITNQKSILSNFKFKCHEFSHFTTLGDYDFSLILSDDASLSKILQNLELGTKRLEIYDTSDYNDLFADYSIHTFQKLLHSNDIKEVIITIPRILDIHIKNSGMNSKYTSINIVDPISISDHYFSKTIIQKLSSLVKCDNIVYSTPTKNYLKKFDSEVLPYLPDKITSDSDLNHQVQVKEILDELLSRQTSFNHECPQELKVTISNEPVLASSILNLISVPHPASVVSALHLNDKHVITNDDLLATKEKVDFLTENFLLKDLKSYETLWDLIKDKENHLIFFNAETLTADSLRKQLSILLGIDLKFSNNNFGIELTDRSKSLNEILQEEFLLSQGEFTRKLDNVKLLVKSYGNPRPYVINQRQSNDKLKQLREKLNTDKTKPVYDDDKILQGQYFESRHDPIIEISENWNPKDANIWHLIKNLRYIDELEYDYLDTFK